MPTYDITSPDGKTFEVTAPEGATQDQVLAYAKQQFSAQPSPANPQQAPAGPQPSTLDRVVASPPVRLLHDFGGGMLRGAADLATMFGPLSAGKPGVDMIANAIETPYQAALARNRNTPGYAAARANADQRTSGGFMDQMTAPFNPAMAGLAGAPGGLDAMNANADAQTAAQGQYAKEHPIKSFGAGMLGGLMAVPAGGPAALPAAAPKQAVPSIKSLRADASTAYDAAHNSGVVASAHSYDAMVADVQAKLKGMGVDPTLHPNTTAALKRLEDAKGQPIDFRGLDTQRKIAGHAIDASATNKADRQMARFVQDHIDDYVDNLKPADLVGGTNPQQAIADLNNARDLYSRSAKANTLQGLIDKAGVNGSNYTASGYENALRGQFRKLANNDRGMSRFSKAEQEAIKRVATGGSWYSLNNAFRWLGKLSPQGLAPAAIGLGSVAAAGPAGLAVPAAGIAGRVGATVMTKSAAKKAVETAALGKTAVPSIKQPPLQLPQMPARGALPYGMPTLLLATPQNQ